MKRPRVLLADDHQGILESVRALLAGEFDVVGEVLDGATVLAEATQLGPDVVVLDVSMPRGSGLQSLPLLRERLPSAATDVSAFEGRCSVAEVVFGAEFIVSAIDQIFGFFAGLPSNDAFDGVGEQGRLRIPSSASALSVFGSAKPR